MNFPYVTMSIIFIYCDIIVGAYLRIQLNVIVMTPGRFDPYVLFNTEDNTSEKK